MKIRRIKISLVGLVLLSLIFSVIPSIQTKNQIRAIENQEIIEEVIEPLLEEPIFEEPDFPEEPSIPGRIEGTGTYFEIKDSEYLNIILRSTEEIKVVLESIPRMISMNTEGASEEVNSTILSLEGLEPNKTYYKYQNSYKNETVFLSDENGSYSWEQDLTQPHHVWIQEEKGTIFIPENCTIYGTWDEKTKTCALNQNVTSSIEIATSSITLDCNNYTVTGGGGGYGVYINKKNTTAIKDCTISNFSSSIYLYFSSDSNISENDIINNFYGISFLNSSHNTLFDNTVRNNGVGIYPTFLNNTSITRNQITNNNGGILLDDSNNNTVSQNNISNNRDYGLGLRGSSRNNIYRNSITNNGYFAGGRWGIYLSGGSYNTISENTISDHIKYAVYLYYFSDNKFYHNNFINNAQQVYSSNSINSWDNGYPSGGNYWSDYKGVDEKSGENQDQPGSDGIGDTYYCFEGGCDRYPFMRESGWEAPPEEPEKWSFALITDLHIGWGIPDYDSGGYSDDSMGQDYYMTERLRNTVQWINDNYQNSDYNIKFVAVTGDISDTAEYSEFITAREILNELEIPYLPLIGNHDVWPYIQRIGSSPDGGILGRWFTIEKKAEESERLGDEYFEMVFWQDNPQNRQKIENLSDSFVRQEEQGSYAGTPYFQNYTLSYGERSFIYLDFAPRDFSILYSPPMGFISPETINWLDEKLRGQGGKKIIVLTHYPFKTPYGFWPWDREDISDVIRSCNCEVFNFAGHTHVNRTGSPGGEYNVVETEPVSQIPLDPFYNLTGEFIRLVQITDEDINYEILIDGFPSAINPYFTVSPGEVSIGQEITFKAYTKSQKPIWYYTWDFGDGEIVTTSDYKYKKTYHNPGTYKVSLTAIVLEDLYGIGFFQEELSWNLQVKEKAKPWWKIFGLSENLGALVNGEKDEDATQNPQNTPEWVVITKKASEERPIAGLTVHFEEAIEDIDLSGLIADTDLIKRKSVIHMDSWLAIIENSKILFVPSTGAGSVYLCPHATSLEDVTPFCNDIIVLNIGEIENGIMLATTTYNDQEYYLVFEVKGTGGGELGDAQKAIKDLNDYIQGLPEEAFKKNPQQRKNALKNKLGEVFIKIENNEYQEAINKLQNDIRAKVDGNGTTEDWIIDPEAQDEICKMIDDFISYLRGLL